MLCFLGMLLKVFEFEPGTAFRDKLSGIGSWEWCCCCMKFESRSIGTGNTIVLLCSADILFSV